MKLTTPTRPASGPRAATRAVTFSRAPLSLEHHAAAALITPGRPAARVWSVSRTLLSATKRLSRSSAGRRRTSRARLGRREGRGSHRVMSDVISAAKRSVSSFSQRSSNVRHGLGRGRRQAPCRPCHGASLVSSSGPLGYAPRSSCSRACGLFAACISTSAVRRNVRYG